MATPDTEDAKDRQYWRLGEDDKRVLYITIVGGLAANIGLVLIVGLGIWEARLIHRHEVHGHVSGSALFAQLIVSMVLLAFALWGRPWKDSSKSFVIFWWITLPLAALILGVGLLAFVGLAAGIK